MIKKNNIRLQITVTKKQYNWLNTTVKILGTTKTKFVRWCLDLTKQELVKNLTKEEFDECVKIARDHTWLDD